MLRKSSKTLLQYSKAKGLNVRHFRCTATASQAANDIPEMPACSFKPSKHEGPDLNSVLSTRKNNLNPALFTFYKEPVYVHQGYMQYLWDTNNKRYLDLFAGIVTVSVGHCHP
uniref:Uncharacterized protein n=1 Tax=Biomphalaria glabrata TaxID=6526 RepID=A0A2C9L7P5_BIOGL